MSKYRKLSHAIYRCEYHIVFVPKYCYRILSGPIAEMVGRDVHALSEWKAVVVRELSVQPDHVHLVCSIPPKIAVSQFVGFPSSSLSWRHEIFPAHAAAIVAYAIAAASVPAAATTPTAAALR